MDEKQQKNDYTLPASILIAAIMISGSIIYLVQNQGPKGAENVPDQLAQVGQNNQAAGNNDVKLSARDVILGDPNAPVTVIEYGDYQCPFCGRFFQQIETPLREEYIKTGKVKMAFRNFQFLGPESVAAAEAAECAKDQKQYWAYHDALYTAEIRDGQEHNGNLNRDLFLQLATNLGLDRASFTSCLDGKKYSDLVKKDTEDAASAGVNSTPTSFVNGQKFQGALPYEQFKAAIENALK